MSSPAKCSADAYAREQKEDEKLAMSIEAASIEEAQSFANVEKKSRCAHQRFEIGQAADLVSQAIMMFRARDIDGLDALPRAASDPRPALLLVRAGGAI
eukprot:SAG31_NODE_8220_length_1494_cov_1.324731_1_plen_99_part_00